MLSISLEQPWWPADPLISWSRFGSVARLPNAHRAHDARHITQLHLGQLRAKTRVLAIAGIGQNHAFRDPSLARPPNLFHRDFRQIEAVGDRHAGPVRSHR